MPYEEFIDPDNRYFQITYRGDLTLEERIAAKARCITIRQERDIRRFFIDSSQIHQDIGAVGFTKFAYSFNKSEFPQGVKLAIFFKDDDPNINFAKMIISNKSIDIRGFDNAKQAMQWLGVN